MACPGRSFLLAACLTGSGCRYHVQQFEVGTPWLEETVGDFTSGTETRGSILQRLGPPEVLSYTLREEVLEYWYARHRGSDLKFLITSDSVPGLTFLGISRSLLSFLLPLSEPDEFQNDNNFNRATASAVGRASPIGGAEALALKNRRLRFNVLRLELDRESQQLLRWEVLEDVAPNGAGDVLTSTLMEH